jgi:hypothetical protein
MNEMTPTLTANARSSAQDPLAMQSFAAYVNSNKDATNTMASACTVACVTCKAWGVSCCVQGRKKENRQRLSECETLVGALRLYCGLLWWVHCGLLLWVHYGLLW